MKYTAIISTDEPLTEDIIQDLKDTMFFGDDPAYALEIEDIKLEQEPTTKNCESCRYYGSHHEVCNYCYNFSLWTEVEPTPKNDLGVDCVARQDVERYIKGFINEYTPEEELEFINLELDGLKHLPPVTPQELIHGKCNQCKYYEGVHNVQGHAPCSYHKIGGVLWNWYCSQFESEG